MDIRELFGTNLRRFRCQQGLTQAALAAKMGVDRAHVSSMEGGRQNVTLLTLWQISEALSVDPSELLSRN